MNPGQPDAAASAKETVMHHVRRAAFGGLLVSLLVACGTTSPAQGPSSTSLPASAGSSTAAAPSPFGTSPSVTAGPESVPPITATHADPALEGQLPTEVSGVALQRSSGTFADMLGGGSDQTAFDAFLQRIGKTEADGTYAAAFDPTNALGGGIFAFKVSGADTVTLLAGLLAIEQADLGTNAATRPATVGGKGVTVVSVGTGVNDTQWVYGRDDVVFVVHAADEAHAAAYLQAIQ